MRKLREISFENFYIVPLLLGHKPEQHNFQHGSNWRELAYVAEGPCSEIFPLWKGPELAWLKEMWRDPKLQSDLSQYIDLYKELDKTNGYNERGEILNKALLITKE